jgi:ElaB/YqjD/DUF883 family membrane-anchored ribosome-binding protein
VRFVDLVFSLCYKNFVTWKKMAAFKDWLEDTNEKIAGYKKTFTKADSRKYKLDFLERVAKRVNEFSSMCGECYQYKGEITNLLNNLEGLIQLSPAATKDYRKKIDTMVAHLRKKHKLVPAGVYTAIGNGAGVALGASLGAVTDNFGAGIGIGAGIGVAVGTALEAKAKKDGKII